MTKDLSKEFGASVSDGLMAFQIIEESLKLYIRYSFKLIRVRLDRSIPFEFSGTDYETAALETLIKIFSKLTSNQELVVRLRQITTERNFLAHQALVKYLGGPEDGSHHVEHSERVKRITAEAAACLVAVQQDLTALNKRIMG